MATKFWRRAWGPFPSSEYYTWYSMIRRCYDPRHCFFHHYGGRGISVCERWRDDFMMFLSDMGARPSPKYSLDRWDNDGSYTPENCRWATRTQQTLNTRRIQQASGAKYHRGRWTAAIKRNNRRVFLGSFESRAQASLAYREARLCARIAAEIDAVAELSGRGRNNGG